MTGGTSSADVHVGVVVSAGSRFETGGGSADMMSVLGSSPRKAVLRITSAQHYLRLAFPRSSTADGVPDGGWWPRSRDPATELPALIAAVADRLDPVHRITVNAAGWDARPQIIMTIEGREVRLDWFDEQDAHTISLIGSRRSRLDLMMIPSETATVLALTCLAIAAGAPTPHQPVRRPAEPNPVDRREPTVGASKSIWRRSDGRSSGRAILDVANRARPVTSSAGVVHSTPKHPQPQHRSHMEPKKPQDSADNEMEIVVTGRNIDAPAHYRAHIAQRLARLERYSSHVVHFDVMIDHEENPRRSKARHRVEITGSGRGPTMRAEAYGPDFSAALELAVGKLEERLRRSHDRRLVHHGRHNPTSVASATAPLSSIHTTDPSN